MDGMVTRFPMKVFGAGKYVTAACTYELPVSAAEGTYTPTGYVFATVVLMF